MTDTIIVITIETLAFLFLNFQLRVFILFKQNNIIMKADKTSVLSNLCERRKIINSRKFPMKSFKVLLF